MKALLVLILWPIAEIAGFILVGSEIGVLPTIGLILLSGVLGGILMRWQGFGVLTRIQAEIDAGRDPGRDIAHGVMILLAGVLLFVPGFLSDIIGLALFLPPVRDLAWRLLRGRMNISVIRSGPMRRRGDPRTIDLDPDEYNSGEYGAAPDPDSPWRRIDDDKTPG